MMTPSRLEQLLSRFAGLSVLVVGDFFLDKYLVLDPALDEPSLETGLDARQVVERRCMPGAAGTVCLLIGGGGRGGLAAPCGVPRGRVQRVWQVWTGQIPRWLLGT